MSEDRRIEALRAAVERSPGDGELRSLLAEALLEAGRAEEAEREYKTALAGAPGDGDLTRGLVEALSAQGRDAAALAILDAHVELATPTAAILIEYARMLLAANRQGEAAERYREAVALDPGLTDAFLARRLKVDPAGAATVIGGRERVPTTEQGTAPAEGEAQDDLVDTERPKITFADVGGMEAVKEQIRLKIVHPLSNPELYKAYGKQVGGGILFFGPPGCGKTHLARATAGEVKASFLSVGIHDVLEMWIGASERNLHAIFEQARRTRPSVLFFDEVDALGASRREMRGSVGRQVINQFLAELDGSQFSNEGLLVLAATNAPWHMDNAFRRPGRFDRVIFVPPPDLEARARILEIHCLGRPTEAVDYEKVARRTEGYSGADLRAIVETAVESKLDEAMRRGAPVPIGTKDLLAVLKQVKPTTAEWLSTARNYVLYSNEGGLYDEVREFLDLR